MGPDDILVSDVGAHKMWIARHYNFYKPNTGIISNGFATMGIDVPAIIDCSVDYDENIKSTEHLENVYKIFKEAQEI